MQRILYFSGTGNTAYVANQIKKQLESRGYRVEIDSIDHLDPAQYLKSECLYFGFPVYACAMPSLVEDFITRLPDNQGSKLRLFNTHAYIPGKALSRAATLFKDKGFNIDSGYQRKMPGSDGLAFLKKEGRSARKLTSNFNNDFSDLNAWVSGEVPGLKFKMGLDLAGKLMGALMKWAERGLKKKFYADERCITCGKCARNCPVENIRIEEKKIEFSDKCMLCMRCIHLCPKEAIQIGKNTVNKFRYHGPTGEFFAD